MNKTTPTPVSQVTAGARIRVAGRTQHVQAARPCGLPARDGGTVPAVAYELDDGTVLTVPAGHHVDVVTHAPAVLR